MPYRIGPNAEVEQGVVGGQPSRNFEKVNLFPERGKHRMHNPSISSLYNIYFVL
jgi:hypothetical protein